MIKFISWLKYKWLKHKKKKRMGSLEFITVEEAKQFVPLRNDMKSDLGDAAYTLSPSKRGKIGKM